MSHTPSNAEIGQRFKQAYALVNGSLGSKVIAQLDQGYELMRNTAQLCMDTGKLEMASKGIGHVRSCITYPALVSSYLKKTMPEAYMDRLLHYFTPWSNDISRLDKSTIDLDEKLFKSMIRLDEPIDFSSFLRQFGMSGSRKAFAIALEESLKAVDIESKASGSRSQGTPILSLIDAYKRSPTAKACLPKEVLDVMQRYPLQLLALHREHRHLQKGGYLRLEILEALFDRAASDEALTDVLLEIAGNSIFMISEHNHLTWIEELTGNVIGPERLKNEIRDHNKDSDARIAMLFYMLTSPHFPADEIQVALRLPSNSFDPAIYIESMKLAVAAQATPNELFDEKAATFIKTLYKRNGNMAVKLIDIPGIPRRRLMNEPVLRDLIMAGDLGL